MSPAIRPNRQVETELLAAHELVGGLDEVGRGSLAGPVTVGLAVVSHSTVNEFPAGLADSKQLTARRRQALVQPCQDWLADYAIAHASPAEIDALGIVGALRLAGRRALAQLASRGHLPSVIILDGVADWLTAPEAKLCSGIHAPAGAEDSAAELPAVLPPEAVPPVRLEVKGDARCAVVAAASVLAKVQRDAIMTALDDPGYGWASNKGYASAAHQQGLARLGASAQHRRSWRLPGLNA
ncbi:Ribonuclease HII [Actinomyces bovis]|uniref:Ribonuclease n=1 Tax=Actinomyces bovis TaxID=1658 RepID=A0ABY1VKM1_9ACTO|nr:ribonuclease HII [Actinomyces bovis]SPT52651.1 Ribonuclease HII [Actinomyces bovis]VEG54546.1 Ribonuclease HII [Actinomyces israelii]